MTQNTNIQKILNEIKIIFPYEIEDYKINNQGSCNFVVEINNEWIFRFVREELFKSQFELEKDFLTSFEKLSPIPVPKIEYVGENFIGYKKIKGTQLDEKIFKSLKEENKKSICKSLGEFLSKLHSMKFEHLNLVEFPMGDEDFWGDIWKVTESKLQENTRQNALDYFSKYFKFEKDQKINKVICHADFHPNHILYDESNNTISGILDFGRLSKCDAAIDFNLIERFYGKEALEYTLLNYYLELGENFEKRIEFQKYRRLFSAVYLALKSGQSDSIPWYIERIEKVFN